MTAPSLTRSLTRDQARAIIRRMRADPAWYCKHILGVDLYDRQLEIIESVRDHEQTSVNGANGVGKDFTIGRVVPWWLNAYAPHAKVIITGPTFRQIQDIVWRETRGAYIEARYDLGGHMLPTQAKWDGGTDLFALGFATDKPANITGFHSPHLLVIVSEAHNFDEASMVMLKRLHPNRLLLSGNPFSESGEFYASHHEKRHLYNAITITAWDSPNVKEGTERYPGVVTRRDIEKAAEDWGEDSPLYQATVDAKFVGRPDGLIPLSWILAAAERESPGDEGGDLDAGIDVAGPGEDETTLYIRHRSSVIYRNAWRVADPRGEVAAALMPYKHRLRSVNIDSAGIGWNFYLHFQDLGYPARPVNVGEAARDTEHFANLKAELYWGLRQRFKDGDIDGLDDPLTQSQVAGLRYKHNSRGQIQIESKEDAAKRGVPSPDRAEGLMLTYAYGDPTVSTADLNDKFNEPGGSGGRQLPVTDLDRLADEMEESTGIRRREW